MSDPLFDKFGVAVAGRYTLVRELGQGGMGAVYLGTDVKLGREVAIKVLPPSMRAYLGPERFQREVQLAAKLSHPHIVPLFEADEVDGFLYYVMEYVAGESLAQRLEREGPLALDEAVRITAEVGDALQYAHERGIVHRDIKPANILLSGGHALVTDFGIAKSLDEADHGVTLTGTGVSVGTAAYMSPEQASGEKRIDARSDVYALAAVLYEMLAGEPPFTGPSAQAIVARIIVDAPRPIRTVRPNIPPHVQDALLRGLAKVPADRPASVRDFVETLSRPTMERPEARPWWRRRQTLLIGVGAVALLVTTGVLVRAFNGKPKPAVRPAGMVLVPAGRYAVGGVVDRPANSVALDSFYIDSTEVTVAAFQQFLDSTRGAAPWRGTPPVDWPATGILWSEAERFCNWRGAALPTEDQWEAAARGPKGWRYPWGDSWDRGRANAGSVADSLKPVGGFPLGRSFAGAVDLIGNAWEWVGAEVTAPGGAVRHIIKGGAFNTQPASAAASNRIAYPDDRQALWLTGFRCAKPVTTRR